MEATKEMCFLCFEALSRAVSRTSLDKASRTVSPQLKGLSGSPFVTYRLTDSGELRGSVGSFDQLPLLSSLSEYAVTAGTSDWRYSPIAPSELPALSVSVSLLHGFQDISDPTDRDLSKHGLRILLDGRQSTHLPGVAADKEWDHETALKHLVRKGGYSGQCDEAVWARAKWTRFEMSQITATWGEYEAFTLV